MIYFVGEKDNGYFVPEIAAKHNEECTFSGFVSNAEELTKNILQKAYTTVILHVPSLYVVDYQNIGQFCKNIRIANGNIRLVVMAEGHSINSQVVQAAIAGGVRFFMLGSNPSILKRELSDALENKTNIEAVFDDLPTEEQRNKKKDEIAKDYFSSKTIAVVGSQSRIGTTTQALQIVKHLFLEGYKVCYIQMNNSDYVQKVGLFYTDAVQNEEDGSVTYQNIEMYYRKENISDILAKGYDFYVYDFGSVMDDNFTLVQYLEKDIRIAVCGSKANELSYIQSVLEMTATTSTEYVFSFVAEADRKDIMELMEDKKKHTYFTEYIPDPFSYAPVSKSIYESIIKPEKSKQTQEKKPRFSFFGKRKKG